MTPTDRREFLKHTLGATGLVLATSSAGIAGAAVTRRPASDFLAATVRGDLDAVDRWLRRDAGLVHCRDADGRSAYALALLHGHGEVAERLRRAGHTPDAHECALALDWECFDTAARRAPGVVNHDHPIGGTAMYAAAVGGAGTAIWHVYQLGGDPNRTPRGAHGRSAVRAALEVPDLATAELTAASLLGNGAHPNLPELDGDTALHAAARRGSVEIAEILIRKGAAIGARNASGRSPLEVAEAAGETAVQALLRGHGRIPRDTSSTRRAYDVDGEPCRPPDLGAFSVIERGRVVGVSHTDLDAVREAVDRHPELAHAVATTTEGAVEAGAHMGRLDIVDYLLEKGAPCSLPTAVMRGDGARVRAFLDGDSLGIHERGAHDFALLWYPVIGGGNLEMMELLLDRGAEIERQHWLGTTALHYAAIGGQTEMAALLIERGADVGRPGRKFGGQPLTARQIARQRGHDDLVRLLESRGATRG